jgi:phosphatidate cytidylyltransferase
MNNFTQRAITGSLFVLLIIFTLQMNNKWAHHALLAAITLGCMHEYNRLTHLKSWWLSAASLLGVLLYVFADFSPRDQYSLTGSMGLLLLLVLSLFLVRTEESKEQLGLIFLGVAYIGFPMHAVHNLLYVPNLLLGTFFLVWTSDTGAYVSGKLLGKRKLMPQVSPGKTWEGLLGGMILTAAVAYVLSIWTKDNNGTLIHFLKLSPAKAILWGLGVAFFGTLGDLFQSRLKREAGVKDSGRLLPGHGGILDRFDAFLFAGLYTQIIFHGPLAIF